MKKSALLPKLDFTLLAKLAALPDQLTALEALEREMIPARKPKRARR